MMGIRKIAERFKIGTTFLHLGSVKFSISGPLRYTFDGEDAVKAIQALNPQTVVPLQYDGWSHFKESLEESKRALRDHGFEKELRILPSGIAVEMEI